MPQKPEERRKLQVTVVQDIPIYKMKSMSDSGPDEVTVPRYRIHIVSGNGTLVLKSPKPLTKRTVMRQLDMIDGATTYDGMRMPQLDKKGDWVLP